MNPGGIRSALTFANSPGGEPPGQVTYGECFTVQPFNNLVATQTLTGAQLKAVLEQMFPGTQTPPQTSTRVLQISNGFTFSYDTTQPNGSKITAMALNGVPIDPGGQLPGHHQRLPGQRRRRLHRADRGTDRVTAPGFDVDALVAYLGGPAAPVPPGPANRITKVA
jgi:5'-nucleotidase